MSNLLGRNVIFRGIQSDEAGVIVRDWGATEGEDRADVFIFPSTPNSIGRLEPRVLRRDTDEPGTWYFVGEGL